MKQSKKEKEEFAGMRACVRMCRGFSLSNIIPLNIFLIEYEF